MAEAQADLRAMLDRLDAEHRARGRTLSELCNRLIVERKKTMNAAAFERWLQDMDVIKRCAEHTGACQGITEARAALLPEAPPS